MEAQITFSNILDFVSRDNAVFSAFTQIRGDLEGQNGKSRISDFSKG